MSIILIVDDSSFMRASLRLVLEDAGYETVEVANVNEVLANIKR